MKMIATLFVTLMYFAAEAQSSSRDIIKQLNQQFLNALVQKDSAALANILADDFVLINPSGMRRNKADNLAGLHVPGQTVTNIKIDSEDIRLFSEIFGIITVWTTNYISSGNENNILKICYMDIYQKRNGKWQAVAAHVTLLQ
jgi:uncharacterized protein (TIGR02246 family)